VVPAWDDRQLGAFGPVAFPDPIPRRFVPQCDRELIYFSVGALHAVRCTFIGVSTD